MQGRRNSSALAMELRLCCISPSRCSMTLSSMVLYLGYIGQNVRACLCLLYPPKGGYINVYIYTYIYTCIYIYI